MAAGGPSDPLSKTRLEQTADPGLAGVGGTPRQPAGICALAAGAVLTAGDQPVGPHRTEQSGAPLSLALAPRADWSDALSAGHGRCHAGTADPHVDGVQR